MPRPYLHPADHTSPVGLSNNTLRAGLHRPESSTMTPGTCGPCNSPPCCGGAHDANKTRATTIHMLRFTILLVFFGLADGAAEHDGCQAEDNQKHKGQTE